MTEKPTVSQARPEDAVGICVTAAAAFGRNDEAELIIALYREDAALLTLVVKMEDVVMGAAVFSRATLESEAGSRPAVLLGPLAVAPPFQGSGVGSILVHEGLARLKGAGEEVVLVVGEPEYYARFGFSHEVAAPIGEPWGAGPAWQGIVLAGDPPGPSKLIAPRPFLPFG